MNFNRTLYIKSNIILKKETYHIKYKKLLVTLQWVKLRSIFGLTNSNYKKENSY